MPSDPPTLARARVTASLGQILMLTATFEEAKPVCEEAVAVARRVGAREIEGHGLNSLGMSILYLGDFDAGIRVLREALEIGLQTASVDDAGRAYANLIDALNHGGRLAEAGDLAQEGIRVRAGSRNGPQVRRRVPVRRSLRAPADGTVERCRGHARSGPTIRGAGHDRDLHPGATRIARRGPGKARDAAQRLERLRPLIEHTVEAQWVAPVAEAAAELALWRGRPLDARAEIRAAFSGYRPRTRARHRIGPLYALGLRAEADAQRWPVLAGRTLSSTRHGRSPRATLAPPLAA